MLVKKLDKIVTTKTAKNMAAATTVDLTYLQACPVVLGQWEELNIVLVGCGGTGSWAAPHLARLVAVMREQGKRVAVTFFDQDRVETKNVQRI